MRMILCPRRKIIMCGRPTFDRCQLAISLYRCSGELSVCRQDSKLSYYPHGMSVASLGVELCFSESSSSYTVFHDFSEISLVMIQYLALVPGLALRVSPAVTWLTVYRWLRIPVRMILCRAEQTNYVWARHL